MTKVIVYPFVSNVKSPNRIGPINVYRDIIPLNSSDSRIHVFDRRSLQHVATLTGHAAVVHDLAVSKTTAGKFSYIVHCEMCNVHYAVS